MDYSHIRGLSIHNRWPGVPVILGVCGKLKISKQLSILQHDMPAHVSNSMDKCHNSHHQDCVDLVPTHSTISHIPYTITHNPYHTSHIPYAAHLFGQGWFACHDDDEEHCSLTAMGVRGINPFAHSNVSIKNNDGHWGLGHRIIVHQKFYSNEIKSFTQQRDPKINGKKGVKKTKSFS